MVPNRPVGAVYRPSSAGDVALFFFQGEREAAAQARINRVLCDAFREKKRQNWLPAKKKKGDQTKAVGRGGGDSGGNVSREAQGMGV